MAPPTRPRRAARRRGARVPRLAVGHQPLAGSRGSPCRGRSDARDLARTRRSGAGPARETRCSSRMTGCSSWYLRYRRSRPCRAVIQHLEVLRCSGCRAAAARSRASACDTGMSTRRCSAEQALRMRVSMSATGSVMLMRRCSLRPYQLALRTPGISPRSASSRKQMRQSPNLRRVAAGAPAPLAAVVRPHLELRRPLDLLDPALLGHRSLARFQATVDRLLRRGTACPAPAAAPWPGRRGRRR